MERCTCVIKKAPTYEVYVQTPCGIHRRMVEDAVEKCAKIAESETELPGPMPQEVQDKFDEIGDAEAHRWTVRITKANIARRIRADLNA